MRINLQLEEPCVQPTLQKKVATQVNLGGPRGMISKINAGVKRIECLARKTEHLNSEFKLYCSERNADWD